MAKNSGENEQLVEHKVAGGEPGSEGLESAQLDAEDKAQIRFAKTLDQVLVTAFSEHWAAVLAVATALAAISGVRYNSSYFAAIGIDFFKIGTVADTALAGWRNPHLIVMGIVSTAWLIAAFTERKMANILAGFAFIFAHAWYYPAHWGEQAGEEARRGEKIGCLRVKNGAEVVEVEARLLASTTDVLVFERLYQMTGGAHRGSSMVLVARPEFSAFEFSSPNEWLKCGKVVVGK